MDWDNYGEKFYSKFSVVNEIIIKMIIDYEITKHKKAAMQMLE